MKSWNELAGAAQAFATAFRDYIPGACVFELETILSHFVSFQLMLRREAHTLSVPPQRIPRQFSLLDCLDSTGSSENM